MGLDGVKAEVGEEAKVELFALVVALGPCGHPGARRLRMAAVSKARLVRLVARIRGRSW